MKEREFETKVIHSGCYGEPRFGVAVPIYETAAYLFGAADEAVDDITNDLSDTLNSI